MSNKLELTWYGKDEPIKVEPRLLIENAGDPIKFGVNDKLRQYKKFRLSQEWK